MAARLLLLYSILQLWLGKAVHAQLPGSWEVLLQNAGIAAMHAAVTRFGTVILLDRTDIGPSGITLPAGKCRNDPSDKALPVDCTAHSVAFDPATNSVRPLYVLTDTWCSSGQFLPDGTLLQTGGDFDGSKKIRQFSPCPADGTCDWEELRDVKLAANRWYSTDQLLPDGRVIIIGGRGQFNVEFFPRSHSSQPPIHLPFLRQTADEQMDNLYPYVHLLPDGNLFIFANQDAIAYNYVKNIVVRHYPPLLGNPRNYPSAGSSAMLALNAGDSFSKAEILICGGAQYGAFQQLNPELPANGTCGRITATDINASWEIEEMPFRRIMGDMVMLPTGDLIIINGAQAGSQGFNLATDPCLNPVRYQPEAPAGLRFMVLTPTTIPRMYHSTANLLPDGRILLAGSNPHYYYTLDESQPFPTELRIEAFSPEYLSPGLANLRPTVVRAPDVLRYDEKWEVNFQVDLPVTGTVEVNLASAPFATHSFSQGQRLVKLHVTGWGPTEDGMYWVTGVGPPNARVAPPAYYMLFVVNQGIPSPAFWLHLLLSS